MMGYGFDILFKNGKYRTVITKLDVFYSSALSICAVEM